MARKLFLIILVMISFAASAQRLQVENTYGRQVKRLSVDSLLAIPGDTLVVPSVYDNFPFISRKGTTLYLWDTTLLKWSALVAGSGTVTSVATNTATGITGGTITGTGTLAIDTVLLSTRAWRQKGDDSLAALGGGGGGSQTLQQVFNTEVGGSVLTKIDTIDIGSHAIKLLSNTNRTNQQGALEVTNLFDGGIAIYANAPVGNAKGILGIGLIGVGGGGSSVGINGFVQGGGASSYGGYFENGTAGTTGGSVYGVVSPSSSTTIVPQIRLDRYRAGGVGADGIGQSIDFYNESNSGGVQFSNQIISKFTRAVDSARTSQFDIMGVDSTVSKIFANFQTGGIVRVNNLADTLSTRAYSRSVGGASGITLGTTTITSGSNGRVIYDSSGFVGEYPISGTGSVAMTASPTFATSITGSYLTASEILITNGSKNIVSAPVATYPSLTELTYLKGVTSAIQTQINAKGNVSNTGTPLNNQLAVWTDATTIEGPTNLTYDGTNLSVATGSVYSGNAGVGANVQLQSIGATSYTAQTYRTTNGGGDATPTIVLGHPTAAGAGNLRASYDTLHGIVLSAGNGTRQIARASINITNLDNTAGSEDADLIFKTQGNGGAMAEQMRISGGGYVSMGTTGQTAAKLEILSTGEQLRLLYDGSNYFSTTVASNAGVTFNATGTAPKFTFSDSIIPTNRLVVPMGEINFFDLATSADITIVSSSDGASNYVASEPGTALTSGAYEFDNGGANDGVLRYTGTKTKKFSVTGNVSFRGGAAVNEIYTGFFKNGTLVETGTRAITTIVTSDDKVSVTIHMMVELATNDEIQIAFGNGTGTDQIRVYSLNLFAIGM